MRSKPWKVSPGRTICPSVKPFGGLQTANQLRLAARIRYNEIPPVATEFLPPSRRDNTKNAIVLSMTRLLSLALMLVALSRALAEDQSADTPAVPMPVTTGSSWGRLLRNPRAAADCNSLPEMSRGRKQEMGLRLDRRETVFSRRRRWTGRGARQSREKPADPSGAAHGRRENAAERVALRNRNRHAHRLGEERRTWPEDKVLDPGAAAANQAKQHWAFQPVHEPPVPEVKTTDWGATPVDPFILAKLESAGLTPSPPADRRTLIRRATFDLTRPAADAGGDRGVCGRFSPEAFANLSIACWHRRTTASVGGDIGSTSPGTPTPKGYVFTRRSQLSVRLQVSRLGCAIA